MHDELVKSVAEMQQQNPVRASVLQEIDSGLFEQESNESVEENSYWWLLHLPEDVCAGRGLVLMDPPYEPYDEYMAWNLYTLRHLYHAWPSSCVAVWYPCFTDEQTDAFYLQLHHLDVGDVLIADFGLMKNSVATGTSLQHSALAVLRPPGPSTWTFQRRVSELLHDLAEMMGGDSGDELERKDPLAEMDLQKVLAQYLANQGYGYPTEITLTAEGV
eukprot:symbB.v1.2.012950.t2/scaffold892.1/size156909/2